MVRGPIVTRIDASSNLSILIVPTSNLLYTLKVIKLTIIVNGKVFMQYLAGLLMISIYCKYYKYINFKIVSFNFKVIKNWSDYRIFPHLYIDYIINNHGWVFFSTCLLLLLGFITFLFSYFKCSSGNRYYRYFYKVIFSLVTLQTIIIFIVVPTLIYHKIKLNFLLNTNELYNSPSYSLSRALKAIDTPRALDRWNIVAGLGKAPYSIKYGTKGGLGIAFWYDILNNVTLGRNNDDKKLIYFIIDSWVCETIQTPTKFNFSLFRYKEYSHNRRWNFKFLRKLIIFENLFGKTDHAIIVNDVRYTTYITEIKRITKDWVYVYKMDEELGCLWLAFIKFLIHLKSYNNNFNIVNFQFEFQFTEGKAFFTLMLVLDDLWKTSYAGYNKNFMLAYTNNIKNTDPGWINYINIQKTDLNLRWLKHLYKLQNWNENWNQSVHVNYYLRNYIITDKPCLNNKISYWVDGGLRKTKLLKDGLWHF